MVRSRLIWPMALVLMLALAGCANDRVVRGAAIGAASGATVGLFTGNVAEGAAVGAASGAAAGFVSGLFH